MADERSRPPSSPTFLAINADRSVRAPTRLREGFRYRPDVLSVEEEEAFARELSALPSKPFDFQGFLANRQVVSFGYRYDYDRRAVVEAPSFPAFLEPLRRKVAAVFDRPGDTFRQVLINEYRPGAGIGWHRDKAQFDEVVGVSLLAPCTLRFRRKAGEAWDRASLTIEPRSSYLLSGPARTIWEHSIPVSTAFAIPSPCGRWLRLRKSSSLLTKRSNSRPGYHRENSHRISDRMTLTRIPVVIGA
jgi:alkylated DNA repair dioxygenase AlkB